MIQEIYIYIYILSESKKEYTNVISYFEKIYLEKEKAIDLLMSMIIDDASEDELLRVMKYCICILFSNRYPINLELAGEDQNINQLVEKYLIQ